MKRFLVIKHKEGANPYTELDTIDIPAKFCENVFDCLVVIKPKYCVGFSKVIMQFGKN